MQPEMRDVVSIWFIAVCLLLDEKYKVPYKAVLAKSPK
jgi:hypothetical protein